MLLSFYDTYWNVPLGFNIGSKTSLTVGGRVYGLFSVLKPKFTVF